MTNLELTRRRYADAPADLENDASKEQAALAAQKQPEQRNQQEARESGSGVSDVASTTDEVKKKVSNYLRAKKAKAEIAIDPDSILFNDISAAVYEEFKVVKKNKWGKFQTRMIGVDLTKIYNKNQEENKILTGLQQLGNVDSVKRAERLISDVVSIGIDPVSPSAFSIVFRCVCCACCCCFEG